MIVCRETYRPCTYSAIGGAGKGRDMFTGRRNSASCKVHPGCECVIVSPLQAALSDGGQVGSMKSPARGHPQIPQGTNWAICNPAWPREDQKSDSAFLSLPMEFSTAKTLAIGPFWTRSHPGNKWRKQGPMDGIPSPSAWCTSQGAEEVSLQAPLPPWGRSNPLVTLVPPCT